MSEEWRPHPKYGDLVQASSLGRVRQFIVLEKSYSVAKQRIHPSGYMVCNLRSPIGKSSVKVHVLVAQCWHGPKQRGQETAHKDGDRLNNNPSNLMWATRHQNALHKRAHGVWKCPAITASESHAKDLRKARKMAERHRSCRVCGLAFISISGRYCSRKCIANRPENRKLTDSDRQSIVSLVSAGESARELAKRFGVSANHVLRVAKGITSGGKGSLARNGNP